MPVACLDVSHEIGDQYTSKQNMLCDRSSTNTSHSGSVDEDSELEVIFEGGVDSEDNTDQDLDNEEDIDEEDEDEDNDGYDTVSAYEDNDSEEESDSDVEQSNCHDVPFWFSYEEADQINEIMNSYTATLQLDEEIKSCVRAPPPFVGRVQRIHVNNDLFTTLDQVSIYKREPMPLGVTLPAVRDVWLLTSWDAEDGLPLRFFEINKDSLLEFWQSRATGQYSYLYCRPVYNTKREWDFAVSPQETPITYASSLHSPAQLFTMYLPKRPVEAAVEDDIVV